MRCHKYDCDGLNSMLTCFYFRFISQPVLSGVFLPTPYFKHWLWCLLVYRGLIGPRRQFGRNSIYGPELYALLFGAVIPIPFWLWRRRFPDSRLPHINMPVFLNGPSFIPPGMFNSTASSGVHDDWVLCSYWNQLFIVVCCRVRVPVCGANTTFRLVVQVQLCESAIIFYMYGWTYSIAGTVSCIRLRRVIYSLLLKTADSCAIIRYCSLHLCCLPFPASESTCHLRCLLLVDSTSVSCRRCHIELDWKHHLYTHRRLEGLTTHTTQCSTRAILVIPIFRSLFLFQTSSPLHRHHRID